MDLEQGGGGKRKAVSALSVGSRSTRSGASSTKTSVKSSVGGGAPSTFSISSADDGQLNVNSSGSRSQQMQHQPSSSNNINNKYGALEDLDEDEDADSADIDMSPHVPPRLRSARESRLAHDVAVRFPPNPHDQGHGSIIGRLSSSTSVGNQRQRAESDEKECAYTSPHVSPAAHTAGRIGSHGGDRCGGERDIRERLDRERARESAPRSVRISHAKNSMR